MASQSSKRWTGPLVGLSALAAGVASGLAFPPTAWWPLMPVGLGVLGWLIAARRVRVRSGIVLGGVFGVGYYGVLIAWLAVVGVWPTIGLVLIMACWYGLLGLVLALVARYPAWPLYAGAAWVVVEYAASRWPLGGFPWGRLAFAAAETPVDGWFPLIGASGVSYLIVVTSLLLPWAAQRLVEGRGIGPRGTGASGSGLAPGNPRGAVRCGVVVATALILVGLGGWAGDRYQPQPTDQAVTVGIIQGNVPSTGLAALGPARTTTHNSLAETIALMAGVKTGEFAAPDLIVWPESSTDTDPEVDEKAGRIVKYAADLAGVPLLIGTLTYGPGDDERRTTSAWWTADGRITDRYHKKNIVPFGEWIPARDFFLPRIPDLKLIGRQTVPGTGAGVVTGQLGDGRTLRVGTLICFEVGYDDTVDQIVLGDGRTAGGEILVVQTNNSALTGTGQMAQQDAITQIRAMETRREFVVSTTNSLSGAIDAAGHHLWQAALERSAATTVTMPLRTAVTPAVAYRHGIEALLVLGPAAGLVVSVARRARRTPETTP
jgi:apolipoprotein N-acyltransferase